MVATPRKRNMGTEVRYNYDGKEVGAIAKAFKHVVVLQDSWVQTVNAQLAEQGYKYILKTVKHWVREHDGHEMTDAQAWLMLHHLTNQGVPYALRDEDADEKVNPAKYVAGSAATVLDSTVGAAVKVISGAVPKKTEEKASEEEDVNP
jgi:hypothetical protein